jgi:hypothetical protein
LFVPSIQHATEGSIRRRHLAGILICSVGLLSGCASKHWSKAGATEAEFNQDSYACAQQHGRDTFQWRPPIAGGPRYGPEVDKDLYRSCMKARGYSFVEGGNWIGIRD